MKDELLEILNSFGYPVFLQGTLNPDKAFPDTFITFWNNSSLDQSHYDNMPVSYTWNFDVNLYSTSPDIVNTKLREIKAALVQAGWIVSGFGYDVPSGVETHTGRAINVLYLDVDTKSQGG